MAAIPVPFKLCCVVIVIASAILSHESAQAASLRTTGESSGESLSSTGSGSLQLCPCGEMHGSSQSGSSSNCNKEVLRLLESTGQALYKVGNVLMEKDKSSAPSGQATASATIHLGGFPFGTAGYVNPLHHHAPYTPYVFQRPLGLQPYGTMGQAYSQYNSIQSSKSSGGENVALLGPSGQLLFLNPTGVQDNSHSSPSLISPTESYVIVLPNGETIPYSLFNDIIKTWNGGKITLPDGSTHPLQSLKELAEQQPLSTIVFPSGKYVKLPTFIETISAYQKNQLSVQFPDGTKVPLVSLNQSSTVNSETDSNSEGSQRKSSNSPSNLAPTYNNEGKTNLDVVGSSSQSVSGSIQPEYDSNTSGSLRKPQSGNDSEKPNSEYDSNQTNSPYNTGTIYNNNEYNTDKSESDKQTSQSEDGSTTSRNEDDNKTTKNENGSTTSPSPTDNQPSQTGNGIKTDQSGSSSAQSKATYAQSQSSASGQISDTKPDQETSDSFNTTPDSSSTTESTGNSNGQGSSSYGGSTSETNKGSSNNEKITTSSPDSTTKQPEKSNNGDSDSNNEEPDSSKPSITSKTNSEYEKTSNKETKNSSASSSSAAAKQKTATGSKSSSSAAAAAASSKSSETGKKTVNYSGTSDGNEKTVTADEQQKAKEAHAASSASAAKSQTSKQGDAVVKKSSSSSSSSSSDTVETEKVVSKTETVKTNMNSDTAVSSTAAPTTQKTTNDYNTPSSDSTSKDTSKTQGSEETNNQSPQGTSNTPLNSQGSASQGYVKEVYDSNGNKYLLVVHPEDQNGGAAQPTTNSHTASSSNQNEKTISSSSGYSANQPGNSPVTTPQTSEDRPSNSASEVFVKVSDAQGNSHFVAIENAPSYLKQYKKISSGSSGNTHYVEISKTSSPSGKAGDDKFVKITNENGQEFYVSTIGDLPSEVTTYLKVVDGSGKPRFIPIEKTEDSNRQTSDASSSSQSQNNGYNTSPVDSSSADKYSQPQVIVTADGQVLPLVQYATEPQNSNYGQSNYVVYQDNEGQLHAIDKSTVQKKKIVLADGSETDALVVSSSQDSSSVSSSVSSSQTVASQSKPVTTIEMKQIMHPLLKKPIVVPCKTIYNEDGSITTLVTYTPSRDEGTKTANAVPYQQSAQSSSQYSNNQFGSNQFSNSQYSNNQYSNNQYGTSQYNGANAAVNSRGSVAVSNSGRMSYGAPVAQAPAGNGIIYLKESAQPPCPSHCSWS